MGFYETAFWEGDSWGRNRRARQSGEYYPYCPSMLVDLSLNFREDTVTLIAEAERDLAAHAISGNRLERASRVLLRSEALSSSRIEGLEAPIQKVLIAEELRHMGVTQNPDSTVMLVLQNIDMMEKAISLGVRSEAMSIGTMQEMHQMLMQGTNDADLGGTFRTEQNWVGGGWEGPLDARYVPPAPEHVMPLIKDLVAYYNTSTHPTVVRAALVHAQFESIHPFIDGNGRLGRALTQSILAEYGESVPLSFVFLADRENYFDQLQGFQTITDEAVDEAYNDWISYFCHSISLACHRAQDLDKALADLEETWKEQVKPRAHSAADRILKELADQPILTVSSAAALAGVSFEAARNAMNALAEQCVIVQNSRNRKSGIYVAPDVIEVLTAFERATRTVSGNTRYEKPGERVSQGAGRNLDSFDITPTR